MAQLAIDTETGDLAMGPGGFYMVTGLEKIRQTLWLRLRTIRGELPYAVDVGVPMVEEVTVIGTSPERIMAIYQDIILGTPGVIEFIEPPEPEYDSENRILSFSFVVATTFGPLSFSSGVAVV